MSILKKCFTAADVDVVEVKRWYKQPNNKTSLTGSLDLKKLPTDHTRTNINIDSMSPPKLSHFYNERSLSRYLP